MMKDYDNDYRISQEAQERDLGIIWKCDTCGAETEHPPGHNEDGECPCGGTCGKIGESYSDLKRR